MLKKKNIFSLIFLMLVSTACCFAQQYTVYFYGIVSPFSQDNQKNLTQDLFCAQIRSIPDINFIDKRNSGFAENVKKLSDSEIQKLEPETIAELLPEDKNIKEGDQVIIFFSKIDKIEEENWKCTFYTKNFSTLKIDSISKDFDSYYKILTDSKTSIAEILSASTGVTVSVSQMPKRTPKEAINEVAMTVEGVSGTWSGEDGITKIVLMRSGRGFVIFNNGASMNISISVEKTEHDHKVLKITQLGNFNASFYPDIPRQKALSYAQDSKPIEWVFVLTGDTTLIGFKNTLGLDGAGNVAEVKNKVKWSKIN